MRPNNWREMSSTARDPRAEVTKWLEWHQKTKSANANDPEVARSALQAVNGIHLMMPDRNDRAEAVRIMHGILGLVLTEAQTGELYDELRKDAKLPPAS